MRHALKFHPDNPPAAPLRLEAGAARDKGRISIHYQLTGPVSSVLFPAQIESARADRLWQHTCFEIFMRKPGEDRYCEFNFSPSTKWAAYRFASRRSGMTNIIEVDPPVMTMRSAEDHFNMDVALDLRHVPDLPSGPWLVALTTIIEEADGRKSYWSLAHPQGNPDFHHADNFALVLGDGT